MIGRLINKISDFFRNSTVIHNREDPAPSTRQLVELFDRFLDGKLNYGLEWDDFISWESSNPIVEEVRQRLGEYEPLLFSRDQQNFDAYCGHVLNERNRLAHFLGVALRVSRGGDIRDS